MNPRHLATQMSGASGFFVHGSLALTDFPNIAHAKRVSVDIETRDEQLKELGPGVRRPDSYIAGIALSVEDGGGYVSTYLPIGHEQGFNYTPEQVLPYVKDVLQGDDKEIVGANLLYDLDFLEEAGIPVTGTLYDVQVAEPLLDENKRGEYDLDSLSDHYLGYGKDSDALYEWLAENLGGRPTRSAQASRIWKAPGDIVKPYAVSDTENPLGIINEQLARIQNEGLTEIWELERDLEPMLLAMRRRGVRIDKVAAQEAEDGMRRRIAELQQTVDDNDVLINTASTIADYCDLLGIKYSLTEKSKQPSITKKWLEKQSDPVLQAVLELRRLEKNSGTFIQGLLEHCVGDRVHCQFNQLQSDQYGTVSGRFSSSNPNLQNIPARDPEMGPLIRGLFIPDEGELWGSSDYSQVEYRLLVEYAYKVYQGRHGSHEMMMRFLEDASVDMHQAVGDLCGISRGDGKTINFGMVYGLGVDSLIASLGYPRKQCMEIMAKYHAMMPFAKKLYREAQSRASAKGYIRTIGGRLRRYEKWEPAIPWEVQNEPPEEIKEWMKPIKTNNGTIWKRNLDNRPKAYKIEQAREEYGELHLERSHCHTGLNGLLQGSAADIIKRAMVDIWDSGVCHVLGAPSLQVHDELNWSVPDTTEGREAYAESNRIMSNAYGDRLKIPLKVDNQLGGNWAECK